MSRIMPVYKALASCFTAWANLGYQNDNRSEKYEWRLKHKAAISYIMRGAMPYGSGFDNGCKFNFYDSKENKLQIIAHYHHMDENGSYTHWKAYDLTITPDLLVDFKIKIKGMVKIDGGLNDYFYGLFDHCLSENIDLDEIYKSVES